MPAWNPHSDSAGQGGENGREEPHVTGRGLGTARSHLISKSLSPLSPQPGGAPGVVPALLTR